MKLVTFEAKKLGHLLEHNAIPVSRREENCGGEEVMARFSLLGIYQRRFETWSFISAPRWFLYRHLLNGSLYFISKTHCWHCPNTSRRSILSFLRGNNNILCVSGAQVIFGAYLHFVFSPPAVNSFTLYWGTN